MSEFESAVKAWQTSNKNLKEFARCCAMVDDKETARLARACNNLSVDTIENYRRAYRLYYAHIESDTYQKMWDEMNISMFVTAAKAQKDYQPAELTSKLAEAYECEYTVEQFRAVLAVGKSLNGR